MLGVAAFIPLGKYEEGRSKQVPYVAKANGIGSVNE